MKLIQSKRSLFYKKAPQKIFVSLGRWRSKTPSALAQNQKKFLRSFFQKATACLLS